MYLGASSCISYQNTINSDELTLGPIGIDSNTIEPSYRELIKPALLRRMSKLLKMGTYTAMEVSSRMPQSPDAIIIGTGLGCIRDTIAFMDQIIDNEESTLAPTSFIQSTHNSLAGQIALLLGNYEYNMTLVQNSLSFEMALMDAKAQFDAGEAQNILVGGADEMTEQLQELLQKLGEDAGISLPILGEGAACFALTQSKTPQSIAKMLRIESVVNGSPTTLKDLIGDKKYDLILSSGLPLSENTTPVINFKDYCGEFFTAPAFAMHVGLQLIDGKLSHEGIGPAESVLILNSFNNRIGLIELSAL